MPLTQPGQYGPEALIDSAGNALPSPTVTVSPSAGYTVTVDASSNLTIVGPPTDALAVTVKVGTTTVRTFSATVPPQVAEMSARATDAASALSAANSASTAAANAQAKANEVDNKPNGVGILEVRAITQAAYDSLSPKVSTTLYVIQG